jgi:hypothetical protein
MHTNDATQTERKEQQSVRQQREVSWLALSFPCDALLLLLFLSLLTTGQPNERPADARDLSLSLSLSLVRDPRVALPLVRQPLQQYCGRCATRVASLVQRTSFEAASSNSTGGRSGECVEGGARQLAVRPAGEDDQHTAEHQAASATACVHARCTIDCGVCCLAGGASPRASLACSSCCASRGTYECARRRRRRPLMLLCRCSQ